MAFGGGTVAGMLNKQELGAQSARSGWLRAPTIQAPIRTMVIAEIIKPS
jgi:hypothetical protein